MRSDRAGLAAGAGLSVTSRARRGARRSARRPRPRARALMGIEGECGGRCVPAAVALCGPRSPAAPTLYGRHPRSRMHRIYECASVPRYGAQRDSGPSERPGLRRQPGGARKRSAGTVAQPLPSPRCPRRTQRTSPRASGALRERPRAEHDRLGCIGGVAHQRRDVRRRLPKPAEHVGGDDPGRCYPAGRRRRARARSPAEPSSRFSDFSPLWPASPPPSRDADVAERQVDLVVDDEDAVERRACRSRAPGPTERPASFMYVCGLQHRDARAARAGAALGQLAGELLLRLRQVPALDERVGDAKPTLCGVLA